MYFKVITGHMNYVLFFSLTTNEFEVWLLGTSYSVIAMHSHEKYKHETIENDIALIYVSHSISSPVVCQPPRFEEFTYQTGILLGNEA